MVPPMNSFEDLMKIVMCMPETNFYVFDVPRAIDTKGKDKRRIWSAIESIKNDWFGITAMNGKKDISTVLMSGYPQIMCQISKHYQLIDGISGKLTTRHMDSPRKDDKPYISP